MCYVHVKRRTRNTSMIELLKCVCMIYAVM